MENPLIPYLFVVLLALPGPQSTEPPQAERDAILARRVWEQAVEAKGGRERLRSVRNMLRSSKSVWGIWPISRIVVSYELLIVPPGRYWHWLDERPSKFGVRLDVLNLDRDVFQFVSDASGDARPPSRPNANHIALIRRAQLLTFLETKWLQPIPRRTWEMRWRRRSVTAVEVDVDGLPFECYFDRRTLLLVGVVDRRSPDTPDGTEFRLDDYVGVDGLKLPSRVEMRWPDEGRPFVETVTYTLNVDYDEQIFQQPPTLARGPGGWRRP